MLEKAKRPGGPGILSTVDMRHDLQNAGIKRPFNPFQLVSGPGSNDHGVGVVVKGAGQYSIQFPNQFYLTFIDPGLQLESFTMTLPGAAGEFFFVDSESSAIPLGQYYPFVSGAQSRGVSLDSTVPSDVDSIVSSNTFTFNFSGFASGDFFSFGLDRIDDVLGYFDDTADRMNGTTYTATFSDGSTTSGIIAVEPEYGYSVYDGYGLINAFEAVELVP
jgi:hypothetical protein